MNETGFERQGRRGTTAKTAVRPQLPAGMRKVSLMELLEVCTICVDEGGNVCLVTDRTVAVNACDNKTIIAFV